jgi:hypothetical protein
VNLAISEAAARARAGTEGLKELAAKQVWLRSVDVPLWGKATLWQGQNPSLPILEVRFSVICI